MRLLVYFPAFASLAAGLLLESRESDLESRKYVDDCSRIHHEGYMADPGNDRVPARVRF